MASVAIPARQQQPELHWHLIGANTAGPGRHAECAYYVLSVRLALAVFLVLGIVALPGCSGCNSSSPTAKAKAKDGKKDEKGDEAEELIKKRTKQREKPKEDFEPLQVRLLPSNDPSPALKQPPVMVKPGHWIAVSEFAKTNNFDFPGELATFVEQTATNQPLELEDKVSRLSSWCPAMLPKGQTKRIEGMFYVPKREAGLGRVYSVRSEIHGIRGGRTEIFSTTLAPSLKDYEHLIVVLAGGGTTPAAYSHFDKLLSVKVPQVEAVINTTEAEPLRYYYVMRPTIDKTAPLPSHPLAWTTIAFVFWDDIDPAVLTGQQQQALLDWLHWGGQLVISGPSSLDKLKGSFLENYLPGEPGQSVKLEQAAFDELNAKFSLKHDPARVRLMTDPPKDEALRAIRVLAERPMLGIEMQLGPAGQAVEGTGGLVVERRVGGGRIAVTRFPLTDVRIKQWKNFDGFFNSVLLRRPPRVFSENSNTQAVSVDWDEPALRLMRQDARIGSTLRYFTRDIGQLDDQQRAWWTAAASPTEVERYNSSGPGPRGMLPRGRGVAPGFSNAPLYGAPGFGGMPGYTEDGDPIRPDVAAVHPGIDDWHFCGYRSNDPMGVAAWDNDGAASSAARQILTEAAGIEIPSADFVMKVLGIYLVVLVPLNWLIFWLLGKVEWAWIAAPIIALVGAGAVIRLAQLDIGFARSRTEVAVLEMQGGYDRGHLTRYTALYTSLSSTYSLAFDEQNALAAPFPAGPRDTSLLSIAQYMDVAFRRDKEVSLTGVQVSSNSTGMVHSEQIIPLGSSPKTRALLRLNGDEASGYSLVNSTDIAVRDIGVFRRVDKPGSGEAQIEVAYVKKLEPSASATIRFAPLAPRDLNDPTTEVPEDKTARRQAKGYPPVWLDAWDQVAIFAEPGKDSSDGAEAAELAKTRIRLTRLARLASDRLRLMPGDVRLVGWTDQRLPGMRIRPEAPQNRTYTLVLSHLIRGPLSPARADRNVAEDYFSSTLLDADSEAVLPPEATPGEAAASGVNP